MKYELKKDESFVDYKTAHYYSTKAAALAEQYAGASPGYVSICKRYIGNNARLLDIGCGTGRDLAELPGITGTFDVILCSGVIQHIQTQFLYESFRTVTSRLVDKGIFILSFPLEYPDIDKDSMRDKDGRLFIIRPAEKYRFLIERQGFIQLENIVHEDSLNREKISWAVHVYRKVKEI